MSRPGNTTASASPGYLDSVLATPRWALGFHRRHLLPITALGLVAGTERFFSRLVDDLPALPLEALTLASRVVLVCYVVQLALRKDPEVLWGRGGGSPMRHSSQWRAFLPYLAGQGVLLLAAMFVFDFVPERLLAPAEGTTGHELYFACLLAVKNLTVIPFTLIWMTGIARRQLLLPVKELTPVR
ncbi:hypothetical protein ACFYVL_30150 [Streptomyces sp. NPDC004111]|uniref:hypothetical protein n=1 Tax=Streptomyces sp. NPDC004111 TaxID=3364690 RepID=UPI00368247F6